MEKKPQQKPKVEVVSKEKRYISTQDKATKKGFDLSPENQRKQRKQRKFIVKKTMNANVSVPTRKRVKHTRKEYRKAQADYRNKVIKHNQLKQSLVATGTKERSTEDSQKIRAEVFSDAKIEKEALNAEKEVAQAKENVRIKKEVYKKTKKADPKNALKLAKDQANSTFKNKAEEALEQQDSLVEGVKSRQEGRKRTNVYQTSKYLVRTTHHMNMTLGKGAYGLSNKSYNYIRGRGFQKTPEEYSKLRQTAKKMRNFRHRLQVSNVGKAAKNTTKFTGSVIRVLNNPLKLKNLAIISGLLLVVFSIFMFIPLSTPVPIKQDEFQLTDSWLHMTKVDAEKSDDTYSFFTPLDDVMFYMNYKFEDYSTDDTMHLLGFKRYSDYMNGIWSAMNDTSNDSYKFTPMFDLAKDKKSKYYMDKDDFEEMKEAVDAYGYETLDGQLDFPYKTDNLPISRRFGYESSDNKEKKYLSIEPESQQGLDIKAPMGGEVTWHEDQKQVILTKKGENGDRLILTGVDSKRQQSGTTVKEGELIAKATGTKLTISYEKYNEDTKKMERVNPAFYFAKVTYRQKTVVNEPFDVEGDELKNARYLYNKLTEKGYKLEGIVAMLGSFSVESGINPKRAEGDYLNPPIGASASSWDDPSWLAIGGMQIYGRFPNILHRGLGLGQWTDTADGGRRHTLLVDYAKQKNKKWYSLGLQLDFMMNGDVPAYRTIFKSVLDGSAGNGVDELTKYFLNRWEGNPGDKLSERIAAAQKWYAYFKANPNSDPGGSTGKYILPISPPNVSSGFGYRSLGDFHRGVDFAHPQGTPIKAIDGGTVITADYHYSWGNHVVIKHDNGQVSLYAHCSALKVKVGDKVKQGDIIGLVGNTGNSFGAHLHLEIAKSTDLSVSNLLDPAKVLGIN